MQVLQMQAVNKPDPQKSARQFGPSIRPNINRHISNSAPYKLVNSALSIKKHLHKDKLV